MPNFKKGTSISNTVVEWLSLMHSFAQKSLDSGSAQSPSVLFHEKCAKCLAYLGCWRTKQWKCLVWGKETKARVNSLERNSAKPRKIRE